MTQSIYPEILFVGRRNELKNFEGILNQKQREKWVIFLYGPGGVGKTQLIKRFLQLAQEKCSSRTECLIFSENDLIDLYWTEHRREESLLRSLAYRLDPAGFQEFFAAVDAYTRDRISDEDTAGLEKLRDAFLVGYSRLKADQIILAFDTAERVTESILRFFRGLLYEMHREKPGTLVLLAGRPEARPKILETFQDRCEPWEIGPLGIEDIRDYLKEEGQIALEENDIKNIAELTEGKPIRVALTIDWLKEGNSLKDLLGDLKNPKEVDRNLVQRVAYVRYPEDWLILYMALFSRRFNEEFVDILLPNMPEKADVYLKRMGRFSFVKYYPPSPSQPMGNWQLHDEMRDLLNLYIWPTEDPTGEVRRQICKDVIDKYYVPKINQLEQSKTDPSLLLDLEQERLHYLLQVNFTEGFIKYEALAHEAEKNGERTASHFEALNAELSPYESVMNKIQFRRWKVNQVIAASFSPEKSTHEHALQMIKHQDWQNWDAVTQAEVRYRLALIYQRSGQQQYLLELCNYVPEEQSLGGEWITWFKKSLQDNLPSADYQAVLLDYARLLTTVGLVYRSQNHMNHAIACFKEAIRACESAKPTEDEDRRSIALAIANAQNNLAFVYQRMGRTDEALAECQAALDIRKRFGNLEQLGYSYNVIGTIRVEQLRPEEAESCFKQARNCFEKANYESGIGLVLVAHGRLLRQWGEYREISGELPEKAREKYEAAEPMLNQAVGIFRRLGDRPNLMEALNEKGTLMRQLRRWGEAEECYRESLGLAQRLSNKYREADNECDLGILYFRQGAMEKAIEHSERAAKIADEALAYYLKSKARQTSASIYLEQANKKGQRKKYQLAFEAAADAATGILRLNPYLFVESAAKRTLEYERVVRWLREKVIMALPSQDLVNEAVQLLVERWKNEIVEPETGKKLVTEFPGFITAMESARRDYQLLKAHGEVDK